MLEHYKFLMGNQMESKLDPLVLEFVGSGPKKRKEIEKWLEKDMNMDFTPRTLTNVLHRLQEKQLIRKIGRGVYALITHITLEEAILNIRSVIRAISATADTHTAHTEFTLTDISRSAMIPESWTFRKGKVEISFEDLVFAELRRRLRESEKTGEEVPILTIVDENLEARRSKRIRELGEKLGKSTTPKEMEEGGEKRE